MLAETAQLAVVLTLKDQLTGGLTAAQAKLTGLEATASTAAAGGMTRLQKAAGGVGTAMSHAGSQIGGLVKNASMLIGGAGLFTIGGMLEQGISKAETMGLATAKLTALTQLSTHSASQLIAVFDKYGIGADKVTTMAAQAEKTLGKLNETQGKAAKSAALLTLENTKLTIEAQGGKTAAVNKAIAEQKATDALNASATGVSKLTALDMKYGLHLVDAKGKVVDFATELNQLADFYNSNASASDKAYVASQLLLKGYATAIPILKLGAKGIAEVTAEADAMGVTLKTAEDVTNVQKFIAAQRSAKEALGGVEMQLGLLVMPDLTAGMTAFTSFVSTHRNEIEGGFKDLLHFAEQIGTAFQDVVIPAIQMIGGVWNSLPGPIKELLIGGFLANKAIKWTFGIDIAGLATKALGGAVAGLIGNIFKNATTGVMSVEAGVVNVGGVGALAGGAGGLAGAAGATSMWAMVGKVIGGAFAITAVAALADAIYPMIDAGGGYKNRVGTGQLLPGDQLEWPFGPKNTPNIDLGPFKNILGGGPNVPSAVPPGSRITTPTNLAGAGLNADRRVALGAQDFGYAQLVARNELSGGLTAQLRSGRVGESSAGLATSITSIFAHSTAPSLNSMSSALKQLRDLQAKYVAQGDTKLAASIGSDIKYLAGRVDAVTTAIDLKQFTVSGGTGGNVGGDPYPPAPLPGKLGPPAPGPGHVGPGANSPLGITVVVHPGGTTARDNKQAAVIKDRWGPTIAGGQAVMT
jgi:hypothetical protein